MPDFLTKLPPEVAGALMAMFISVLRVIYDKEDTNPMRIILEAPLKADQITWKDGKTAGYALNDLDGSTAGDFAGTPPVFKNNA